MKNRKIIFFLVPLVLLIWGVIISRIVSQVRNRNWFVDQIADTKVKAENQTDWDTLVLMLDYPDPFLGRSFHQESNNNDNQPREIKTTLVSSTNSPTLPLINYSGLVINPKNKKKTGLIRIDQKDHLVKEGESIEGEKVLKLYQDSVILVRGKIRRTLKRNNS